LRLVSDVFPTLMLYSWRTSRLLSPLMSGWISILTVKAYGCHLFREVYCSCATCHSCTLAMLSLSHCISEEIPVRCYMLRFVAVYFIHVALILLLMFIWLLCFDSHVILICVCDVLVCGYFWPITLHYSPEVDRILFGMYIPKRMLHIQTGWY